MTIDTKDQPVNIKHLLLTERQVPKVVDPATEFTQGDWTQIVQRVESLGPESWLTYLNLLTSISILNPTLYKEILPNEKPRILEGVKQARELKDCINYTSLDDRGELLNSAAFDKAASARVHVPEFFADIKATLPLEVFDNYYHYISDLNRTQPGDYSGMLVNLAFIFPERVSEIQKDEQLWESLSNSLRQQGSHVHYFPEYYATAAALKLIYPHRFKSTMLDPNEWKELQESDQTSLDFVQCAASLRIALADKVKITDEGIEITMPEKPQVDQPTTLPDVRKF